jgi:hypothetical protein
MADKKKKKKRKIVTEALANRMMRYRVANNLSQKELAEVLIVKPWVVAHVEAQKAATIPMSTYIMFKGLEDGGQPADDLVGKEPNRDKQVTLAGMPNIMEDLVNKIAGEEELRALCPEDFKIVGIDASVDDVTIKLSGRRKDVRKMMNKLLAG